MNLRKKRKIVLYTPDKDSSSVSSSFASPMLSLTIKIIKVFHLAFAFILTIHNVEVNSLFFIKNVQAKNTTSTPSSTVPFSYRSSIKQRANDWQMQRKFECYIGALLQPNAIKIIKSHQEQSKGMNPQHLSYVTSFMILTVVAIM